MSSSSDGRNKWMPRRVRSHADLRNGSGRAPSPPSQVFEQPPASPSTPRISETSSISSPGSTPPKKTWERHYRSFLSKRNPNTQSPVSTSFANAPPPPLIPPQAVVGGGNNKGKFSLVAGSKRLITRTSSSDRGLSEVSSSSSAPKPRSGGGDATVKGGSFFSQVFQHKDAAAKSPNMNQRKIKSLDTLDTTVRRGQEKSYSPRNTRFVHGGLPSSPGGGSSPSSLSSLPMRSLSTGDTTYSSSPHNKLQPPRLPLESVEPRKGPLVMLPATTTKKKPSTSTEIKKAFTEFHNRSDIAGDTTSAFLGEDNSVLGNSYFAMYNQMADPSKPCSLGGSQRGRIPRTLSNHTMAFSDRKFDRNSLPRALSNSLDPVTEEKIFLKSERMLKPVTGPESWSKGRRYLIAPAILAMCPFQVLPKLSGSRTIGSYDDSAFGVLPLGRATVKYVGQKDKSGWSTCSLVLRQNYLLEYERDVAGIPRGYVHLQNGKAYKHADFHNALELEFFGSPCAKADKRTLLVRVDNAADRDRWVTCLNDAANLSIKDLYDYEESSKIGTGRYASVYKARRRDGTDEGPPNCAIKVVDKSEFWRRVVKGMERADTLVREASVQATLAAKGTAKLRTIVKLRSLFETSDNIVFEVELLEGTDLFQHVSSNSVLGEIEAAHIAHDILLSLDAMNRHGVAHRDIKPANILMCKKSTHGVHVKVADFGMSTFAGVDGKLRGRCGTPGYVAPEIFSAGLNGGYGNKVDIFSAGVTLYVMLCGYEPFYGETDAELIEANREAVLEFPDDDWDDVSADARELVQAMLLADPSKRISAKDALKHPWIVNKGEGSADTKKALVSSSQDYSEGAACIIS